MSDWDGLRSCPNCGNDTTGRLCRTCAEQEAIDYADILPARLRDDPDFDSKSERALINRIGPAIKAAKDSTFMPRKAGYRNLSIILSPAQYAALEAEAKRRGVAVSEIARESLAAHVPDYPADDVPKRGTYDRKKS